MRHLKATLLLTILLACYTSCKSSTQSETSTQNQYCQKLHELSTPTDLTTLIDRAKDSRLVLLGESTHGTADYYYWRAEISKRLIEEQGFEFIVVEGDWAALYKLNLYVKGLSDEHSSAREVQQTFDRWPDWMWGNTEIEQLAEWMLEYNQNLPVEQRVGFYGMDVYGQWEAMESVLSYVKEEMPEEYNNVKRGFECFTAFDQDEWRYARAVQRGYQACFDTLDYIVSKLAHQEALVKDPNERKALRHAKQSAKVVRNAEDYFRLAVNSNVDSWNSRVMHMHSTVTWLMDNHGSSSKGIVWAHNTHIGDARATTMRNQGQVNIGQLSRELYSDIGATLIGFTTYKGKVNAGSSWASPMQIMDVPQGKSGSLEDMLNQCGKESFYTIFDEEIHDTEELLNPIEHRAIGVVYNPATERMYNYVPSIVPLRYDAIIFIRDTKPLEKVQ